MAMLADHRFKVIRHFSSGMKQRVKLITALTTQSLLLLLDEPLSNLDETGESWFFRMLNQFGSERIVIVARYQEREYSVCNHRLDITAYKS
jgi:ABC-type multidrug transport system ATPase subunit